MLVYGGPFSGSGARPTPQDIPLGPLVFRFARELGRKENAGYFKPRNPSKPWRFFKTVATVLAGQPATVSVAPRHRDAFLLLYDPSKFTGRNAYVRADGNPVVRFGRCEDNSPRGHAEFTGGFLARRPGCFEVGAHLPRRTQPIRRTVNIGMGFRACT